MKKLIICIIAFAGFVSMTNAQVDIVYQKPPREILELVDAPQTPSVVIDDKNENMILFTRNKYSDIAELSETELRLAGLRINPVTNTASRATYYNHIALMKVGETKPSEVGFSSRTQDGQFFVFARPDQHCFYQHHRQRGRTLDA
jgi:hypothetical protein